MIVAAFVSVVLLINLTFIFKWWTGLDLSLCTSWYGVKLCFRGWWIHRWFKPLKAGVFHPRDFIIPFIGPQVGYLRDSDGKWAGYCHMGFGIWEKDFEKADASLEDIKFCHRMIVAHWKEEGRKTYYVPWPGPRKV